MSINPPIFLHNQKTQPPLRLLRLCVRSSVSRLLRAKGWLKATHMALQYATLCASLLSVGASAASPGYGPRVGEPHPDFVLPSLDGREPTSLSQFRGKKVLLLHFASW